MEIQDQLLWGMYFLTIAGWQYHPGNKIMEPDLEQAAKIADMMIQITKERLKCQSQPPQ